MGEIVRLHAKDGHTLDAYAAQPGVPATAGLVIVQEIFGVSAHIRSVADRYADDGFVTIAPALFDRIERDVDLKDEGEDRQRGVALLSKFDIDKAVDDIAAAVEWLEGFGRFRSIGIGVVGYCLGGTLAWLSAARLPIAAAVGYYGGRITQYLGERPKAPIILQFGEQDQHIPQSEIDAIAKAHREVQIYTYPAGHAFNREGSHGYDAASAERARERTLAFLREHLQQNGK
jgi:carboxymethylenebutenolidase